ncbi:MAG TPA: acyltransferase, partial [Flavitalea sp.]|nr:acyltransferase [Flavitalea sp.]
MNSNTGMQLLFQRMFHLFYRLPVIWQLKVSTFLVYQKARMMGINIGSGCEFFGMPKIIMQPGSNITIGKNCDFRSCRNSNPMLLNHRCVLFTLTPSAQIHIGHSCGISGVSIGARQKVIIGNNVLIGKNSEIMDSDWHPVNSIDKYNGHIADKAVIIEDNVFIGMSCIILKGVHIGRNSVIGAGSIVTRSLPAN